MGWLSDAFDFVGDIFGGGRNSNPLADIIGAASPWLRGLTPAPETMTPEQRQLMQQTIEGRQRSLGLAETLLTQGFADPEFYKEDDLTRAVMAATELEKSRRRQVARGGASPFNANSFNRDKFIRTWQAMAGLTAPERALGGAATINALQTGAPYAGPANAQQYANTVQQQQTGTVLEALGGLFGGRQQPQAPQIIWNSARQLPNVSISNTGGGSSSPPRQYGDTWTGYY